MRRFVSWAIMLSIGVALSGCEGGERSSTRTTTARRNFSIFNRKPVEQWTIECAEFPQRDHRLYCEQVAETLRQTSGIRAGDVRCQHDASTNSSRLIYGTYERRVDPRTDTRSTPPELTSDLQLIADLGDEQGRRFFVNARMVQLGEMYDGPPEWALENAQGIYTLQIAAFFPELGFNQPRQAAVEMVRQFRREGVEAYYHFAGQKASVTIGTFGADAVREDADGRLVYSAEVQALQRKREEFGFNYENGQKRTKIVQGRSYPPYSFLVRIPQKSPQP